MHRSQDHQYLGSLFLRDIATVPPTVVSINRVYSCIFSYQLLSEITDREPAREAGFFCIFN